MLLPPWDINKFTLDYDLGHFIYQKLHILHFFLMCLKLITNRVAMVALQDPLMAVGVDMLTGPPTGCHLHTRSSGPAKC